MEDMRLTGDELAAEMYARSGRFVIGSFAPLKMGQLLDAGNWGVSTPLRVVGLSNRKEFDEECEVARNITGVIPAKTRNAVYYYRVEAAD